MMKSKKIPIPVESLAQHIVALGKTGSGKSSKLRVIVEYLLEEQLPVCIIDPKGDWWGLKSSGDGKSAGYPLVIFGGEHADVPINDRAGAQVAELVATGNRPCLIDLGGWMVNERTRFFIDFASSLFRHTRGHRYLVIDEAHNFAPKGKIMSVDAGKMLHWANRIASEGRSKGLTVIAASQRPQKVHNDFLTSCETLIAGRVIHKADRDAIRGWIDGCADGDIGKQVLAELASMPREEAWVWSPEIDFGPSRIKFPMFTTYDSFKPQPADLRKLAGWADVDLDEVKCQLSSLVEEAAANDPKALKRQVEKLQRELRKTQRGVPEAEVKQRIREAVAAATADRHEPVDVTRLRGHLNKALAMLPGEGNAAQPRAGVQAQARQSAPVHGKPTPAAGRSLRKGALRILGELAARYPSGYSKPQVGALTKFSHKGGTFGTYLSDLRKAGYIEERDGLIFASEAGIESLGENVPAAPATHDEVMALWRKALRSGAYKMLEAIVSAGDAGIDRYDLAVEVDMSAAGGTFGTYLSDLSRNGLITKQGSVVVANDILFP